MDLCRLSFLAAHPICPQGARECGLEGHVRETSLDHPLMLVCVFRSVSAGSHMYNPHRGWSVYALLIESAPGHGMDGQFWLHHFYTVVGAQLLRGLGILCADFWRRCLAFRTTFQTLGIFYSSLCCRGSPVLSSMEAAESYDPGIEAVEPHLLLQCTPSHLLSESEQCN